MGPTASAPVLSLVTPWANLTLQNGWAESGGWQTPQYRKLGDMVYCVAVYGREPSEQRPRRAQPPVGFRPPGQLSFPTEGGANFRWFLLTPGGELMWYTPANITADTSSFHMTHQFSTTP